MNILFNASMYFEKPSGVGIYTKEIWNKLYEPLDEKKIHYDVYSYCNDAKFKNQHYVKLPFALQVLFKRFLPVHRLLWNIFYLPVICKRYDLVYSFSSHGSPFIKNQIITIHDLICFSFPKQHRFQYFYFKYILPYIIKACKKIVVVSEFTRQEVIKQYNVNPGKIKVILNGGDHLHNTGMYNNAETKELQNKIESRFFLTVGASFPHKNVERLLNAMQQPGIEDKLVIVGSVNSYYKHLQNIANKNKMKNIVFLQYVSSESLNWLYNNCIANVYISLYEGFGFPPLEAAMHNKISIVSNTSALKEIYKDAALFVNPYNINEISNALKQVASPQFDNDKYLSRALALVDKYTWKRAADNVADLIISEANQVDLKNA